MQLHTVDNLHITIIFNSSEHVMLQMVFQDCSLTIVRPSSAHQSLVTEFTLQKLHFMRNFKQTIARLYTVGCSTFYPDIPEIYSGQFQR